MVLNIQMETNINNETLNRVLVRSSLLKKSSGGNGWCVWPKRLLGISLPFVGIFQFLLFSKGQSHHWGRL